MRGGQEDKKPQKMVRSSIACARCRRSKVKCVNLGINSTCKACAQSNRDCTYPTANPSSTPKRSETSPNIKQEHDGENKKRPRKVEDPGRRGSTRASDDPLDSHILTKKVWVELYDLFKLHFSTEMPFLHPPRFRKKMYRMAYPRDPAISPAEIQESKILLLGVLTLTARFHPELVAYHSSTGDHLAASEYYALALAAAFGPIGGNMTKPSLEGIQGLLMLSLYEWGQTKGLSAWVYLGIAIRLAQSMGLEYEDDPDINFHKASPHRPVSPDQSPSDIATDREVRRRTLWSCFVMDRALSAGKFRPSMIHPEKSRVRLPQTENNFLFENHIETGFLISKWQPSNPGRPQASVFDNGVLSAYVRLVEIFGRFSEWSYAGGRRTEPKSTPWDPESTFYFLRRQLEEFHNSLPSNLTFTEANLSAHIEQRNATPYASLHTLYSLCLIMLHREYVPFVPLRCEGPEGPLDEPTFPKDKYPVPPRFWADSAEVMFKASRDILEIVSTCQDSNALPESPQIGFAVYQAAFVAVYAGYFRHMDQRGHVICADNTEGDFRKHGYTALAEKILQGLVPKLRMVKWYLTQIQRMHTFYKGVINDYFYLSGNSFVGGGLEQYKQFEKGLKEFGSIAENDRAIASDGSDITDQNRSRASTNEFQGPTGEPMQGVEALSNARTNPAWAPINRASPPAEVDGRSTVYQGRHSYGPPYQQQSPIEVSSNVPSLVSASNGDTTPTVHSPYINNQLPQYQPISQPQHPQSYSNIAHHTMAPPNPQNGGRHGMEQKYEEFMNYNRNISISGTGFDNYAQDIPYEDWGSVLPMDSHAGASVPYIHALGSIQQW